MQVKNCQRFVFLVNNRSMFFTRFGNIASLSLFASRSYASWLFAQGGYGCFLVRTAEGEQDDKDGGKDNTQRDQKGIVHRKQEGLLLQLFDGQFRRYKQRVLLRYALAHQVRRLLLQRLPRWRAWCHLLCEVNVVKRGSCRHQGGHQCDGQCTGNRAYNRIDGGGLR